MARLRHGTCTVPNGGQNTLSSIQSGVFLDRYLAKDRGRIALHFCFLLELAKLETA